MTMLSEANRARLLPLHSAAAHRAPATVVRRLVELHPTALKVRSAEQMVPLHYSLKTSQALHWCNKSRMKRA